MGQILNKTVCATAVITCLGCSGTTWNNRTKKNVWLDRVRSKYSARSITSKLGAKKTLTNLRKIIKKINDDSIVAYVCTVREHVFLINTRGERIVDTFESKRRLVKVYALRLKNQAETAEQCRERLSSGLLADCAIKHAYTVADRRKRD